MLTFQTFPLRLIQGIQFASLCVCVCVTPSRASDAAFSVAAAAALGGDPTAAAAAAAAASAGGGGGGGLFVRLLCRLCLGKT